MAKEQKKRAVVDKWKKKKHFKLIAPKLFGNVEFGETISAKPEQLIGRIIRINMSFLTNQIRHKTCDAILRIGKVEGSNAYTELAGFLMKHAFLRRLFRRRTSKIEIINTLESKDKKKIKIKYVCVTFGRREVLKTKQIRKELEKYVQNLVKENSAEKFLELCLNSKELFAPVLATIKKICPINAVEIEQVKIL